MEIEDNFISFKNQSTKNFFFAFFIIMGPNAYKKL